jgi:hypothetical protein
MLPIFCRHIDPDFTMSKLGASPPAPLSPPTPAETAHYIRDLLESLRKMALAQDLKLLSHLLGLAAIEARTHLNAVQRHDTKLPD